METAKMIKVGELFAIMWHKVEMSKEYKDYVSIRKRITLLNNKARSTKIWKRCESLGILDGKPKPGNYDPNKLMEELWNIPEKKEMEKLRAKHKTAIQKVLHSKPCKIWSVFLNKLSKALPVEEKMNFPKTEIDKINNLFMSLEPHNRSFFPPIE